MRTNFLLGIHNRYLTKGSVAPLPKKGKGKEEKPLLGKIGFSGGNYRTKPNLPVT
ncbi:hypothetical protein [Nostoc sp. NMS4]|uniref:hypothetical protein n=1 Tax=Nostoc sp. NMS4 TaxID=2815390 RepID=UPI0025E9F5B1|nr:hypothetical protein [Nostoc sp. NMS4]MBN3926040.1 hypothetical protein [Nostoc sp. NMS4]